MDVLDLRQATDSLLLRVLGFLVEDDEANIRSADSRSDSKLRTLTLPMILTRFFE